MAKTKEIIDKAMRGGYNPYLYDSGKDIEVIVFSHEFLKAYFGEEKADCTLCEYHSDEYCDYLPCLLEWQYHGQQLVLSEDREEYLRRYLD